MKLIYKKYFNTIVLAGVVFLLSVMFSFSVEDTSQTPFKSVLINEGDTLWGIANQYENHSLSKVEFIAWIEEYNGVRADKVQPGQTIVIPVKRDHVQNVATLK
jgi:hypothetical protein